MRYIILFRILLIHQCTIITMMDLMSVDFLIIPFLFFVLIRIQFYILIRCMTNIFQILLLVAN